LGLYFRCRCGSPFAASIRPDGAGYVSRWKADTLPDLGPLTRDEPAHHDAQRNWRNLFSKPTLIAFATTEGTQKTPNRDDRQALIIILDPDCATGGFRWPEQLGSRNRTLRTHATIAKPTFRFLEPLGERHITRRDTTADERT
jgi:hypothetical protein